MDKNVAPSAGLSALGEPRVGSRSFIICPHPASAPPRRVLKPLESNDKNWSGRESRAVGLRGGWSAGVKISVTDIPLGGAGKKLHQGPGLVVRSDVGCGQPRGPNSYCWGAGWRETG
jgi:hypothetical protein